MQLFGMTFTSIETGLLIFSAIYFIGFFVALILVSRRKEAHVLARAAFLLSYVCLIPALNYITSTLAIILGISALKDIKKSGQKGRSLAITAIALGAVALALSIVGAIVYYVRTIAP